MTLRAKFESPWEARKHNFTTSVALATRHGKECGGGRAETNTLLNSQDAGWLTVQDGVEMEDYDEEKIARVILLGEPGESPPMIT